MSNLGLFSGPGGPAYNQFQLKTSDDIQNNTAQANLNALLFQNQQNEALAPLKQEYQGLLNEFQKSKNLGETGLAKQHVAQGDIAEAGTADNIAVNKAESQTKLNNEQVKQLGYYGEAFGQLGSLISSTPPNPGTRALVESTLKKLNVGPDNPIYQQVLAGDPSTYGEKLTNISKAMALATKQHLQTQDSLQTRGTNALNVANAKIDSQEYIAELKVKAAAELKNMDSQTKLELGILAQKTKLALQENKVITIDQLVAKRQQIAEQDPNEENKQALENAKYLLAIKNGQQGRAAEAAVKGLITENLLGEQVAPNNRNAEGRLPASQFTAKPPTPVTTGQPGVSLTQPTVPGAFPVNRVPTPAPVNNDLAELAKKSPSEIANAYRTNPKFRDKVKGLSDEQIYALFKKASGQ